MAYILKIEDLHKSWDEMLVFKQMFSSSVGGWGRFTLLDLVDSDTPADNATWVCEDVPFSTERYCHTNHIPMSSAKMNVTVIVTVIVFMCGDHERGDWDMAAT